MKKLKYSHPASCGYSTKKVYFLDDILKEMNIDKIKVLFKPIDFKWEDLDEIKPKKEIKIKPKEVAKENKIDEVVVLDRVD